MLFFLSQHYKHLAIYLIYLDMKAAAMKKKLGETQTLRTGRRSQKFSPRCRPPSWGRTMAKI